MPRELSETLRRDLLRTARTAAQEAQEYVARRFSHQPGPMLRKGAGDFVTETDIAVERRLARFVKARHPEHGFLGEELEPVRPDAEFCWVVDPIDGTSNFGNGLGIHAVSIACLHHGTPVAAAVHCQPEDVTYAAAAGLGAFRGRRRLTMPDAKLGDGSVIGVQWLRGPRDLDFLPPVLATGTRVRNLGSTVVHLCHLAAGRIVANIQEQGHLWDYAAAGLVVLEAGGRLTDWEGRDLFPAPDLQAAGNRRNLAAGPRAWRRLVRLLPDS